ncbi:helix-turn-helix domain-containing protein [Clostridium intestinale]|uniref:Transcriptional regulator n=1 Tax=Clostridium intestinale URNW TaxID=1294142 RepID=U2Q6H5_9CLOT|nr:helix-turn-helix transcriptional regulator [Clostridium intestinale]ERK31764.1 transcriptional regulator [Clostridium intestinale URNW]
MKITPIRLKRLNAGIELEEAVEKLGVSRSTVYKVEQGHLKPSRDLIRRMSKVYQCSTDEIFKALKM